jgi:hypothetical protein
MMCPGVPYITKNTATAATPLMFKYPSSYQVARANAKELQLKKPGIASPFAMTSLYELVLR